MTIDNKGRGMGPRRIGLVAAMAAAEEVVTGEAAAVEVAVDDSEAEAEEVADISNRGCTREASASR